MDIDVDEFLHFLIEDGWIPRGQSDQRERIVTRYHQSRVENWYSRADNAT